MPRPQAPAGFVAVGPGVYINLAPVSAVALQPHDSAPNVILIFGWMGALTRHLHNYSRKYAELYPHASQIVVKCEPSFFWTPAKATQNRLLPVVEILESLSCLLSVNDPTEESARVRPRILVHSFSNGGAFQLMSLGALLSSKYPSIPPSAHHVSALVMDSSPAIGGFQNIGKAFTIAIRNPVLLYLMLPLIYLVYALRLWFSQISGIESMETHYTKTLLQPRLLPWMNSQTPRLYVFSKKDELVPWQEVQQHAEAGKMSGLHVRCDVYEESAHVAHMRLDPERYWTAIQDLWQTACRERQAGPIETV